MKKWRLDWLENKIRMIYQKFLINNQKLKLINTENSLLQTLLLIKIKLEEYQDNLSLMEKL